MSVNVGLGFSVADVAVARFAGYGMTITEAEDGARDAVATMRRWSFDPPAEPDLEMEEMNDLIRRHVRAEVARRERHDRQLAFGPSPAGPTPPWPDDHDVPAVSSPGAVTRVGRPPGQPAGVATVTLSVVEYFQPDLPRCGATEYFDCDKHAGHIYVYRCCNLPARHESRFHQEWQDGVLVGESSGHPDPMPDAPRCDHLAHTD